MKDTLVTLIGGGGFIGRYIAQELLAAGVRVRIAERDPRRAWFLGPLGGLGQTQFAACDVRRPDTVARAVAGSDAVVYLVGTWGPDFVGLQQTGLREAAAAAHAAGVAAFVDVSTIGADAESPSRYYATKGAGEAAARAAFPDLTVLRPSVVFGPEDKFLNRFAAMVALLPVVPVLKPKARFQPVHVVDVARAVARVLADPRAHAAKTYELAGPEVISMIELIEWLAQATGRSPAILPLPDVVGNALSMFGFLPGAPIKRDQWKMLQSDNVASGTLPGLSALGIAPTPMEAVAPAWLVQYRKHGRFSRRAAT
ncbi:complex I NDUFA9 subunit family protein [Sphingomonas sp.]|jgi:NADH dehydrogenase|uniref:complex I NDUFA9 subunit family protein n=1 Tax=Sphingomonas sp. TaxID=28214 RepID=UPI002E355A9A|nr:complex I NDUFA9 subunit family protein [Sphingomonas sp.]HEX4695503.1 complex I NDUFA9 subunit family protein [Sphingomonas sp.]